MDPVTLGVASGVLANATYDGFRKIASGGEKAFVGKCVKNAASDVEREFDGVSKGDLRPILVPRLEELQFSGASDDIDSRIIDQLADPILAETEVQSPDEARDVVQTLLQRVERELMSEPSSGLPVLLKRMRQLESTQESLQIRLEQLLEKHQDDLARLERYTDRNLSESFSIPGLNEQISYRERSKVFKALDKSGSAIVHGQAGVGKSGLLVDIASEYRSRIPVFFIDARECAHADTSGDLQAILDINHRLSTVLEQVANNLGGCLLVVDQLDNVRGTGSGSVIQKAMLECTEQSDVHVLTACRTWDLRENPQYDRISEELTKVELTPLDRNDVSEYLGEIGIQVPTDAQITKLGQNLLNLSIIGHLAQSRSDIDFTEIKSQISLWETYRESLIEREAARKTGNAVNVLERATTIAKRSLAREQPTISIQNPDWEEERLVSRDVLRNTRGQLYQFKHDQLRTYFYAWSVYSTTNDFTNQIDRDGIPYYARPSIYRWILLLCREEGSSLTEQFLADIFAADTSTFARLIVLKEIQTWNARTLDESLISTVFNHLTRQDIFQEYFFLRPQTDPTWGAQIPASQLRVGSPEVIQFYRNIADDEPEIVATALQEASPVNTDELNKLIRVLNRLPPQSIATVDATICCWLTNGPTGSMDTITYVLNFVTSLFEAGYEDSAFKITARLLRPYPADVVTDVSRNDDPLAVDDPESESGRTHQIEVVDEHTSTRSPLEGNYVDTKQPLRSSYVLEKLIPAIVEANPDRAIALWEGFLRAVGMLHEQYLDCDEVADVRFADIISETDISKELLKRRTHYASPRRLPNDPWFLVRRSLDDYRSASAQTTGEFFVYGLLITVAEYQKSDAADESLGSIIDRYLDREPPFHRIAISLLEEFCDDYSGKARTILRDPDTYRRPHSEPEIRDLFATYSQQHPDEVEGIVNTLETEPIEEEEKTVAEWITDGSEKYTAKELYDWLIKNWYYSFLSADTAILRSDVRERYKTLRTAFREKSISPFRHEVDLYIVETMSQERTDQSPEFSEAPQLGSQELTMRTSGEGISPKAQLTKWIEEDRLEPQADLRVIFEESTLTDNITAQLHENPEPYLPHLSIVAKAPPKYWQYFARRLQAAEEIPDWEPIFDFAETILEEEMAKTAEEHVDCGELASLLGDCEEVQYMQRLRDFLIRAPTIPTIDPNGTALKTLLVFVHNRAHYLSETNEGFVTGLESPVASVIQFAAKSDHMPFARTLGRKFPILQKVDPTLAVNIQPHLFDGDTASSPEKFFATWHSLISGATFGALPIEYLRDNAYELMMCYLDDSKVSTTARERRVLYDMLVAGLRNGEFQTTGSGVLIAFFDVATPTQTHLFASRIHTTSLVVSDSDTKVTSQRLTVEDIVDFWQWRLNQASDIAKYADELLEYTEVLTFINEEQVDSDLLRESVPALSRTSGGLYHVLSYLDELSDPATTIYVLGPLAEEDKSDLEYTFGTTCRDLLLAASDLSREERQKAVRIARTIAESGDFQFVEVANSLRELS